MRNGSIKNTSGRSLTVGPFFSKRLWPRNCHVQQKSCVARTSFHARANPRPSARARLAAQAARNRSPASAPARRLTAR
uniref:Uncharacterized protein n=1 Tax=Arundo donax TaxID=35708 RepID=A0A0A9H2H4_ARUDO